MSIPTAIELAAAELDRLGFDPLTDEQIDCLSSAARHDEMLDMLDDFQARLGFDAEVADRIIDLLTEAHGFGSASACEECERSFGPHFTGPCAH